MPCVKGTPNCTVQFSNDTVGVLSGYNAGTGYDLATGLGSVNVGNLLSKYGPNFFLNSPSPSVMIASPGASGTFSVTATSVNGFSGTVALACSGLPTGATCSFSPASPLTLTAGGSATTTVTVNTTAASRVTPVNYRGGPGTWTKTQEIMLLLALCLGVLIISTRESERRWSTAAAVAVLAILIGSVACGGGSSSTGSSGTTGTAGATTAVVTGTSSTGVAFSMNFSVTIQ
jgi:hypothetical protein